MSVYQELAGEGWTRASPPPQFADESVIALWNNEPIKSGVQTEVVEDSLDCTHLRYRTGEYDIDLKIDPDGGWVKIE